MTQIDSEQATDGTRPKRLLIVDDDPVVRLLIKAVAESVGAVVVEFENGRDAIAYLQEGAGGEPPALILADIYMPYLDGVAFCSQLARDALFPLDRVVLVSAATSTKDIEKIASLSVGGFLQKPFVISELRALLRAML
jgi:CheY-like chemotaxis protein